MRPERELGFELRQRGNVLRLTASIQPGGTKELRGVFFLAQLERTDSSRSGVKE